MPINPIDIMRSQEASQYKHIESQKVHHEQVQISKSFQNLIHAEQTKTTQAEKSENKEFRYDAKDKGRNSYSGSKNKKDKKEENKKEQKDLLEPKKSGGIDILI
ncbi:hypothetical protein I5677_14035 [Mobilitalea sibirica]|uniref:Uncharacterized protein n=1 Tax=Mobilitalea sibirica TaxID=1462919 RepID=A0A8J7H4S3_9FIRM|nr:hypothetical protein [Mobilitalea sibirica]MBH1942017.1 hypothetical protein [Mobilitalea sibirica]